MGRHSKGGVHRVTKRLADGTVAVYSYAWAGGPRIVAPEGSRAFEQERKRHLAAKNAAPSETVATPGEKTLENLIDAYLDSPSFRKRAKRTKKDYRKHLLAIPARYRKMPVRALPVVQTRGVFLRWRDELALASPRQADYAWTVLNVVLNWAVVQTEIPFNPCARAKVEKLYSSDRKNKVWLDPQIEAFRAVAADGLRHALTLAFWTAQRQGDLLRLEWSNYDGEVITLTQSKTNVEVVVPVAAPLKAMLDSMPRRHERMLVNQDGKPWSEDGFRVMWAKTCQKAGIANSRRGGVTFHDLRGTAASRMGQAGCTTIQIASITGHGLESKSTRSALDGYVKRDISMARKAIELFEAYEAKKDILNQSQPIDFIEAKKARFRQKTQ